MSPTLAELELTNRLIDDVKLERIVSGRTCANRLLGSGFLCLKDTESARHYARRFRQCDDLLGLLFECETSQTAELLDDAALHSEDDRINELEMWGPSGRPDIKSML